MCFTLNTSYSKKKVHFGFCITLVLILNNLEVLLFAPILLHMEVQHTPLRHFLTGVNNINNGRVTFCCFSFRVSFSDTSLDMYRSLIRLVFMYLLYYGKLSVFSQYNNILIITDTCFQ